MAKTAYINARIIDPHSQTDLQGGLIVNRSMIEDYGSHITRDLKDKNIQFVDCQGQILAPGLVDMRVMMGSASKGHQETLQTVCQAANAGGVTCFASLPSPSNNHNSESYSSAIQQKSHKKNKVKIYHYGSLTLNHDGLSLNEMGLLTLKGAVGFTDDTTSVANAKVFARALEYAKVVKALILHLPCETSLVTEGHMNNGELATRMGLNGIPREAEIIGLERDIRLVEMTGGRYHATNISTAESVNIIRRAKDQGLAVTCDTSPSYFCLSELDATNYRTYTKLIPPLRSNEDRQAIARAVQDGTIDVITSDHRPESQDSKRLPFAAAHFGAVGLETLLSLSLSIAEETGMSIANMIASLTIKPASILGLQDAGKLSKKGPADFIVFNPQSGWKLDAKKLHSKSKNTPFDKRPMIGKVLYTVVDGIPVFSQKEV